MTEKLLNIKTKILINWQIIIKKINYVFLCIKI